MAPTRRRMMAFKLDEISTVDRPAQTGAMAAIIKGATKTEGGKAFPASDYAYVPDKSQPSTWKLRLTSTPGGSPDAKIVGAAAAALGPGYRGQKVQIPTAAKAKVVARVRAAWQKANPDKDKTDMPEVLQKSAVVDMILKYYIDPSMGAVSFSDAMEVCQEEQQYSQVVNATWPLVSALDSSLRSIIGDRDMDPDAKQNMLRQSVEQFLATIQTSWPDVEEALEKVLGELDEGEDDMNMIATLKAQIADLTKKLDEVTKAGEGGDKLAALAKQVEELTKANAELTAKAKKDPKADAGDDADNADDAADCDGMSDDEKSFYAGLKGKKAKKEFAGMSAGGRKDKMKANKAADETVEVAGQKVSKSAVGDAMFMVLKAQAAETTELRKQVAEEVSKREDMEIAKRVDAEFPNLPGTPAEKVAVFKNLQTLPKEQRETVEKMLKAGNKAISGAFEKLGSRSGEGDPINNAGHTGGSIDKAARVGFLKHVDAIAARDKCSKQQAMRKAREEHPADFAKYQGEENEASVAIN